MMGTCRLSANCKFVILLILCTCVHISAELYYITPDVSTSCPEQGVPCMTLSHFATTHYDYSAHDNHLVLMSGNHTLCPTLTITGTANLSIHAIDNEASILCNPGASFTFYDIDEIQLHRIEFVGCPISVASVNRFSLDQCKLKGNKLKSGLELINVDYASIHRSVFAINTPNGSSDDVDRRGGAMFVIDTNVLITSSSFESNSANTGGSVYAYNSSVMLLTTNFTNNRASDYGGAIAAFGGSTLVISESTFTNNSIEGISSVATVTDFFRFVGGGAVRVFESHSITILNSIFVNNTAQPIGNPRSVGGAVSAVRTYKLVTINNSVFVGNKASVSGGAMLSLHGDVVITNSVFDKNTVSWLGVISSMETYAGACGVYFGSLIVDGCSFHSNSVWSNGLGGAIANAFGFTTIRNSIFVNNTSNFASGALDITLSTCYIANSTFENNTAIWRTSGAGKFDNCSLTIQNCSFHNNTSIHNAAGAILFICSEGTSCPMIIEDSVFTHNSTSVVGGAVAIFSSIVTTRGFVHFEHNNGSKNVFFINNSEVSFDGNTTFCNNMGGTLVSYSSHLKFGGHVTVSGNHYLTSNQVLSFGLGTLAFQHSEVTFSGVVTISDNVVCEGAISSKESKIKTTGNLTVARNTGLRSGSGVYLFQGEFIVLGTVHIENNAAEQNGGGVYASGTTITLEEGSLSLTRNSAARNGGAMYLESGAKIYLNKRTAECENIETLKLPTCGKNESKWLRLQFSDNSASYGGAVYVADDTTSNICNVTQSTMSTVTRECFLHVVWLYDTSRLITTETNFVKQLHLDNVHFLNNSAIVAGDSLYGGLLDRCAVSRFAEVLLATATYLDGATYLSDNISNIKLQDISSRPVRVCFCNNHQPDCSYQPPPVNVRKGETFNVSVVAVDQVNHAVRSRIRSSVPFNATLNHGQAIQPTSQVCTNLTYNVKSPFDAVNISMFAVGPCRDRGISITSISLEFISCPTGFVETTNACDCHPILTDNNLVLNCTIDTQTIYRAIDIWIAVDNMTGSMIYAYCPFENCNSSSRDVNLNAPKGSDTQCAYNRTAQLCGHCDKGLSLLLGGSRCGKCSDGYLALLIFFAIAGIALVAFILVCNLTVAVGTLNGLIFYANIVPANSATFFPMNTSPSILTFIAWINLDFGIETCFYNGMDDNARTWLEVLFLFYVIFLSILTIIIGEKTRFSTRVTKSNRNPIAVLATIILLSYTKVLRLVISGLSFARIYHVSEEMIITVTGIVWRVDATLDYLEPKRIPLVLVMVLLGLLGFVFTIVLLCWQCLSNLPHKLLHMKKWIPNPRLKSFVNSYYAPFKDRHRYWLGLQLLFRIVLYVVATANANPRVNLWITTLTVAVLLMFVNLTGGGIYKAWILNTLESSFLFNALVLSAVTAFGRNEHNFQVILAYVSTTVAFITFLGILAYHTYTFVLSSFASVRQLKPTKIFKTFSKKHKKKFVNGNMGSSGLSVTGSVDNQRLFEGEQTRNFTELREIKPMEIDSDTYTAAYQSQTTTLTEKTVFRNVSHTVIDGVPCCEHESDSEL